MIAYWPFQAVIIGAGLASFGAAAVVVAERVPMSIQTETTNILFSIGHCRRRGAGELWCGSADSGGAGANGHAAAARLAAGQRVARLLLLHAARRLVHSAGLFY